MIGKPQKKAPEESIFRRNVLVKEAHGPTRLRRQPSPSLKAPSLRIPSPGAGQQGQYPLQDWPLGPSREEGGAGPRRASALRLPGSSEPLAERREDPWALCHSRCYSYRPLPKDGKIHEGNGPRRQGREGRTRGPRAAACSQPLRCALPPAGGGKPRSSHRKQTDQV
ncbi:uncharacterized protein [Physeter macrocephalus]|uniref:Uncharacterized protein isoform X2 n=1 Tax=Physeter macrocephalus TaxID=9755 RepID=A0A9W2WUR7_PHYMC|nr:uncharacterized protein LOC129392393 isoform X2 [Physeter catodon]